MEILSLGGADEANTPAPKSRKKISMLLGIGALAAITGIGSTLAANISLNGGGNVEFGQGVATTAACDDNITLTPISTFSNTYYESTFAMTAIQISGIDLTPEGWNDQSGLWNTNFDRATGIWSGEDSNRAGQYINADGYWTNTCENKVLMLRAYTDNYPEKTVLDEIESPLYLTGDGNGNRPAFMTGTNPGVAFRFTQDSANSDPVVGEIFEWVDENGNYTNSATYTYNTDIDYELSSLTIYLDGSDNYPPLDSRWVDKLTIESAAELPSSWID